MLLKNHVSWIRPLPFYLSNTLKPNLTKKFPSPDEAMVRKHCTTVIKELVVEALDSIKEHKIDSTELEQKIRAMAENPSKIIDPAVNDLSQKFNACVDKYMSIPNNVAIPDFCLMGNDVDPTEDNDELEQQLTKQLQELELVFKQQTVLCARVDAENKAFAELEKDIKIDEGLCELLQNSREDMNMESLNALLNVGKKVKTAVERL